MKTLLQQFLDYIHAGYSAFYFQTAETSRIKAGLTEINQQLNLKIREYDLAYGELNEYFQPQNKTADPSHILEQILDLDFEQEIIYVRGIKALLQHNPLALNRLRFLIEKVTYQYKNECIIVLQDSELFLPKEIEPFITLLELPHPKETEIKALINAIQLQVESAILPQLITSLSGLTELDIQQLLTLIKNRFKAISKQNKTEIFEEIQQSKEQIIAKSGVLEMVKVTNTIDDIGGLENLKQWVKDQSYILANLAQAKAFGVKAPKGTLIVGMPGCGKSLTAKATATLFQQPLLRLDIGSLLGKYVGESETNMRKALAMAESISPCVLWVDELEKAFVGMSGNNASEVSSRLLGYFLTWLQEKTAPVFIVATANDITALPPELLRKGRFDEIFYVGFPNTTERKQILSIHLKKAKQKVEKFDLSELARLCRDYSGADIENAVYEAVKKSFIKNEQLTSEGLKIAIKETTPLKDTLKEKVKESLKKFAEMYLTNASLDEGFSYAKINDMISSSNYKDRVLLAEYDEIPRDILEILVKDEVLEVRRAVFKNPNCSEKILANQLFLNKKDPLYDYEILNSVYMHPNTSYSKIIDKLDGEYIELNRKYTLLERYLENKKLNIFEQTVKDELLKTRLGKAYYYQRAPLSIEEQVEIVSRKPRTQLELEKLEHLCCYNNIIEDVQYKLFDMVICDNVLDEMNANDKYNGSWAYSYFQSNLSLNYDVYKKIIEYKEGEIPDEILSNDNFMDRFYLNLDWKGKYEMNILYSIFSNGNLSSSWMLFMINALKDNNYLREFFVKFKIFLMEGKGYSEQSIIDLIEEVERFRKNKNIGDKELFCSFIYLASLATEMEKTTFSIVIQERLDEFGVDYTEMNREFKLRYFRD